MRHIRSLFLLVPFVVAGCGDDGTAVSARPEPYPLETCLVSGEKIGSMGDPVVIVHDGQEIKFCCDKCVPKFKQNPEKYLAKLEKRVAETAPADHSGHSY